MEETCSLPLSFTPWTVSVIFALKKNNMADKDLTRGIKIYLDTTKYSQGMKQLSQATREYEFTLKGLREAGKGNTEQAKRLEAQIAQNKKIYQQYSAELNRQKKILENLDKATYPELVAMQKKLRAQVQSSKRDTTEYTVALQQLTRVNLEVAEAQKEMRRQSEKQQESFSSLTRMKSAVVGFFAGIGASAGSFFANSISEARSWMSEGIRLAANADGVRRAFDKLDRPGMLSELRKATKDTVNDLELMQAAVRAKDFRIPLEDLGKYLQFARLKAQQTGQSVDYLTDSILTGLGRKSLLIRGDGQNGGPDDSGGCNRGQATRTSGGELRVGCGQGRSKSRGAAKQADGNRKAPASSARKMEQSLPVSQARFFRCGALDIGT